MREDKNTLNEIGLYLSFGNGKAPDLSDDGVYPVYGSNGIIGRSKSANHEHSIILGRVGAYCGSVHFEDGKYWATDNTIVVKTSKGNEAKFFYNLLKAFPLRSLAGGSAQPLINQTIIKRIEAWVPSLPTQRKIAAILTAYDDLIEINKRRIALLENMAEEIYREWFLRLRFPGHQNTRFVKGVPEGWPFEIGTAFFDHVKGKSYASHEISDKDGLCFFITLKSFHRRGGYRKEGLKYFSGSYKEGQSVEAGDVVMAVTDMTQDRAVVGEVARIPKLRGKKAVISLDVIRLMPKNMSTTFLYAYMRYSGFADYIKQFANGANVLHLKPDLVGKQKLLFPPADLRDRFSVLIEPFYQEVDALETANRVLTKTRDLLLPRLISGKLSVEDLDIQLPPSMQDQPLAPANADEVRHA